MASASSGESNRASSADRAIADLEARLRAIRSPLLEGLRPGLTRAEVRSRLDRVGGEVDPALVALYSWHDGAEGGGPRAELMEGTRFLPLAEAITTRDFELGLAVENEFPPELLAAEIYDPAWFPVLKDIGGLLYVVDQLGAGHVLMVDHEHVGNPEDVASSLLEFLDGIARDGMDFKPPPLSADVTVLVRRLESADSREQWSVVRELTRKRPPEAFAPLVAMLESDDAHARRDAALLLGVLDDRGAVPILIRCIAQWTGNDVTSAIAGLASIGKEGAIGHLEKALATGDQELRMDAVAALVACRDARGVPALQAAAARDSDLQVREAARRAIRALGEQG